MWAQITSFTEHLAFHTHASSPSFFHAARHNHTRMCVCVCVCVCACVLKYSARTKDVQLVIVVMVFPMANLLN